MDLEIQKKIGLYIRVSSDKQLEEGFSFQAQEEKLVEEAKREKRDYILYKDGGITGKNMDKREGLKSLMNDVEIGLIDKVYVTKISRLARNSRDLENIIYEFEKNNVYFKAISDGIDTSTPIGSVMVKLLGIFAEMERDIIIEQTRAGAEKRAKEGKMYGSGPIFGYDRVPNGRTMKIVPNEKERPIVERIFRMYLGGYGYKAIANRLNKEGYRTKKHKLFAINTIKTILDNPLYAGYIRYGKYRDWTKKRRKGLSKSPILVEGNHEGFISYDDYEKVKKRMSQNQRRKPPVGKYILSGILTCPECGSKMVGSKTVYKTKRGKVERLYYTCSRFHNKGTTACHSNGIRVDLIDPIVLKKIARKLNSQTMIDNLYNYIVNNTIDKNSIEGQKRLLDLEIAKLKKRKIELRNIYSEGFITSDEFKEDIEKTNIKQGEYDLLINELGKEEKEQESTTLNISKKDIEIFLKNIIKNLKIDNKKFRLKVKELLKIMIRKVDIVSKSELDIKVEINYENIFLEYFND